MPTIAPTASSSIQTIHDPRIKEKLQELRQTDNTTNILYFCPHLCLLFSW